MIIAQVIGFIAFGVGVYAYLQKDDKKLIIRIIFQNLLLIVHFSMLDRLTGALMQGLIMSRNVICLKYKMQFLAPVFVIIFIIIGYYTYDEWQDVLPVIGTIISTLGYFFASGIRLRACLLSANILWVIHNAVSFSIGPFFMEIVMGLANIRTIWVLYNDQKAAPSINKAE